MDRAHRVGQVRDVEVLKLVIKDSIEEHIMKLATIKLKLDRSLSEANANNSVMENNLGDGDGSNLTRKGLKGEGKLEEESRALNGKKGKKREHGKEMELDLEDEEFEPAESRILDLLRTEWLEKLPVV